MIYSSAVDIARNFCRKNQLPKGIDKFYYNLSSASKFWKIPEHGSAVIMPKMEGRGNPDFATATSETYSHPPSVNLLGHYQGTRSKDLIGIPWRAAFALQADGWYLRSDIIWAKPNPMPESVTDRPTKSHEYIFLLTKQERYYYDAEAIAEPSITPNLKVGGLGVSWHDHKDDLVQGDRKTTPGSNGQHQAFDGGRNRRTVWAVPTSPYAEAHFATFPPDLIKPCILAGTKAGDTVLDPFGGSGTTGMVAFEHGRNAVLIELNPDYSAMAERRCCNVTAPLFP